MQPRMRRKESKGYPTLIDIWWRVSLETAIEHHASYTLHWIAYLESSDVMRCKAKTRYRQAQSSAQGLSHGLECRFTIATPVLAEK